MKNGKTMSNVQPQAAPHPNQHQLNIRPPDAFDFMKPEGWPAWEKRFLRFTSIANLSWKTDLEKTDLLCYTMGEQSEEILRRIIPDNDATFEEVLKAFRDHFVPKKNVIRMRSLFNSRVQLAGESVDTFIAALYSLAEDCDYSILREDLIRDKIVVGIRNNNVSEQLKLKSDLTLAIAIREVRQAEARANESELNHSIAMNKKKHGNLKGVREFRSDEENCWRCGFSKHLEEKPCPAKNSICRNCRQYGHWDKVCGLRRFHHSTREARASEDSENASARASIWHDSGKRCDAKTSINLSNKMNVCDVGLRAVAASVERFGCRFFHVLANSNPGKNLITSPLSVQIVLAMAAYGAEGQTAMQMNNALHLPRDTSLALSGYHSLIKIMNSETAVELCVANRVFVASYANIKPAYQKLIAKRFLSSVKHVDFKDSQAAADTINTWCEKQTSKRIKNVIEPMSLGPDTGFILMNAVYFKGQWKRPFQEYYTYPRPFHIDGITKMLPVMSTTDHFRFGDLPKLDARFIQIPYKGEKLSMIIILPNSITGLKKVQDNLHYLDLRQILQEQVDMSVPTFVTLELPKFKIQCTLNLGPILERLGMSTIFLHAADFSGITDTPLYITKAVQVAFIEVNETGTEAAAVMSLRGGGGWSGPPLTFKVDRPFYFAIYHHQTEVLLFSGIVKEPAYA